MKTISINISTYLLLFMAFLAGYLKYLLIIYGIILFHELGHIICFKIFRIPIIKTVIYPFGGICYIDKKIHESIIVDIICAGAGLVFQILLYFIISFIFKLNLIGVSSYDYFCLYNKYLFVFNLLPILPLDGSKVLFAFMTYFISFDKSYKLISGISILTFIIFVIYNIRYKANDMIVYGFLIMQLLEWIKNYKYIINKFYLERMISDHSFNAIINDEKSIKNYRLNKYYYMYKNGRYIDEKKYIKDLLFSN